MQARVEDGYILLSLDPILTEIHLYVLVTMELLELLAPMICLN